MALIKCPECGKDVEEQNKFCPECGCLIKKENNDDQILEHQNVTNKNKYKKQLYIGVGICLILLIGVFLYFTSDSYKYNSAKKEYENENYQKATKIFEELGDYKDSLKLYKDAKYKYDVANDKIPPTITMLSHELTLEQGQQFNSEQFINDNAIKSEDNISKTVNLNIDSSKLDVNNTGQYEITIEATDESGNLSSEKVIVNVKNSKSEEIISFVNNLPKVEGVKSIEYDESGNTVIIKIEHENIKEVAYAAKESLYVKTVWARLTDAINEYCKSIYDELINNNYDIEAVSIFVSESNDLLFSSVNGNTFIDVSN